MLSSGLIPDEFVPKEIRRYLDKLFNVEEDAGQLIRSQKSRH
jgi:hypothetical protein